MRQSLVAFGPWDFPCVIHILGSIPYDCHIWIVKRTFWVDENDLDIDNYKDLARGEDDPTKEEIVKSIQKRKKYTKLNNIQREYVS